MSKDQTAFQPSWVDRLIAWIERQKLPDGVIYLSIFLLIVLVTHILYWVESPVAFGTVVPTIFIDSIWLAYMLILLHILKRTSRRALRDFNIPLAIDSDEYDLLTERFTNMPARPVFFISLIFFVFFVVISFQYPVIVDVVLRHPVSIFIWELSFAGSYIFLPIFVFYSVRQLKLVNQIYSRVENIQIFSLQPYYGMANVTTQLSLIWFFTISLNVFVEGVVGTQSMSLNLLVIVTVALATLALLMFLVPLIGIHNQINREKNLALEGNGRQIEALYAKLYDALQLDELKRVADIEGGLIALFAMREKLTKVPAWPWMPGTPGRFISAILLPLGLGILQQILSRFF
jgi:hypothetical protein